MHDEVNVCHECQDDNTLCPTCAEQIRAALSSGRLEVDGDRPADPVVARMQQRYVGTAHVD